MPFQRPAPSATSPVVASGSSVSEASTYLLVLSDGRAIAWVLGEQRMAFRATRPDAVELAIGDELLIYATAGAYKASTWKAGRIIGRARVVTSVQPVDGSIEIAGRMYSSTCDLSIELLAPWGAGVELKPLVEHLTVFPDKRSWGVQIRRTLLALPDVDARLLDARLESLAGSREGNLNSHLAAAPSD